MIALVMVEEIKRLLNVERLSQRSVSRQTGVSRGIVQAIASGRRPDYADRQPADDFSPPQGPLRRCPTCGGKVLMPCLLCRVRAMRRIKG